jgi:hypothetical protein
MPVGEKGYLPNNAPRRQPMTVHDLLPPLIGNFEEDRQHELELAQRAVTYLATQGLERRAVIACLVDEFDLDEATAEELASLAA